MLGAMLVLFFPFFFSQFHEVLLAGVSWPFTVNVDGKREWRKRSFSLVFLVPLPEVNETLMVDEISFYIIRIKSQFSENGLMTYLLKFEQLLSRKA